MNYYDVLQISETATVQVVHAAYRALSKERHPDAGGSSEEFAQLNEAYETLSDDARRQAYNTRLAFERQMAQTQAQPIFDPQPGIESIATLATLALDYYGVNPFISKAVKAVQPDVVRLAAQMFVRQAS